MRRNFVYWIHLAQGTDHRPAVVNAVKSTFDFFEKREISN